MRQRRLAFLLGGLLAAAAGCTSHQPVQVQVTLDGKPVDGATVTLKGEGEKETPVSGFTGDDGIATLTAPGGKGVPPGTYKVLVSRVSVTGGKAADLSKPTEAMQQMLGKGKGPMMGAPKTIQTKQELPAVYGDPAKSTLTLKVPPDSSPAPLELKSKP